MRLDTDKRHHPCNGVLQALGQMPYAQVVSLVLKIQQQAQAQMIPPEEEPQQP